MYSLIEYYNLKNKIFISLQKKKIKKSKKDLKSKTWIIFLIAMNKMI